MLHDEIYKTMMRDFAMINKAMNMPGLRMAEETARIIQSVQLQHSEIYSRLFDQISDAQRIAQDVSRTFREHYLEVLRRLDSTRTIQSIMPNLLSDTVSGFCSILQRSGFQELADLHSRMIECVEAFSTGYPEIRIVGDRVWIDNEEVILEDFDETGGFDIRKIDDIFWQQWESLPRTVRLIWVVIFYIALTYSPMVFQKPNATQLDQQQVNEAVQEAICKAFSDPRTLEALFGNLPRLDIQAAESTEDTIEPDDLLESKCDVSEENMLKNHGCPLESDHLQTTD